MNPKISVICPTYNRGYDLRQTIHSILDQTFEDWELLIVDDGSSDNTYEVVKSFKDDRIRYYLLPHTGCISKVRNYGIDKARGELVVVQDSDDISYPDRLDVFWSEYQNTGADVLYHSVYWTCRGPDGCVARRYKPAQAFDIERLVKEQYITAHIAVKTEVAKKVRYNEDMLIADDWPFLIELALQGYKFHAIARALYEYWYSEDSINIKAEADGRRQKDLLTLVRLLKTKYNIKAKPITFQRNVQGFQ